jgi:branched-chain amino acid transport system permease protein
MRDFHIRQAFRGSGLDSAIFLFLLQDGITNGAIYALLGLALVLVFAVTRVILIPQGEFVTFGALTYAALATGKLPGTVGLIVLMGVAAFGFELFGMRYKMSLGRVTRAFVASIVLPLAIAAIAIVLAPRRYGVAVDVLLTLVIVAPLGPYLYRIAFQPMAQASVLTLLIASVGAHLALLGYSLIVFGAEGLRGPALSNATASLGPLTITGQSLSVYAVTIVLIIALRLFFERSLYGKALRATAVNRIGARLAGIRTSLSGQIAFLLAAAIGAVSGILLAPITTTYYDTGFLIGLKGFVAAIIGGLASYPVTALAALVVGFVEALSSFYASNYKEVIVFTLIVPVLMARSLASPAVEDEPD